MGLLLKQRLASLNRPPPRHHRRNSRPGPDDGHQDAGAEHRFRQGRPARRRSFSIGAGDNVVRLLPPLIISDAEIARGVERLGGRLHRAGSRSARRRAAAEQPYDDPSFPRSQRFLGRADPARPRCRAAPSRRSAARASAPTTGRSRARCWRWCSTSRRPARACRSMSGMRELGGETLMLTGREMQLGRGETIADTARVLSRYVDAIMIRTLDHAMVTELAECGIDSRDQWPDQNDPSVPDHGRRHDLRRASRTDHRPHDRLDGRCQQRAGLLGPRRRAA